MDFRHAALSAVLLSSLATTGAVVGWWGCPNQAVEDNFNIASYAGTWYEYSVYLGPGDSTFLCPTEVYTSASNGLIDVVQTRKTSRDTITVKGQLKLADPSKTEGKLSIIYIEDGYENKDRENTKANYNVLATDYTKYSIVWECTSLIFLHITRLRIMTRDRSPAQSVIDEVYQELNDRGIKTSALVKNSHDNC